jgi:hypothetical protein
MSKKLGYALSTEKYGNYNLFVKGFFQYNLFTIKTDLSHNFDVRTAHLVQFIIQTDKRKTHTHTDTHTHTPTHPHSHTLKHIRTYVSLYVQFSSFSLFTEYYFAKPVDQILPNLPALNGRLSGRGLCSFGYTRCVGNLTSANKLYCHSKYVHINS